MSKRRLIGRLLAQHFILGESFGASSQPSKCRWVQYENIVDVWPLHVPIGLRRNQAVFLALQVVGGHIGLPAILIFTLYSRRVRRDPTFLNFCITWIFSSVAFSFLCVWYLISYAQSQLFLSKIIPWNNRQYHRQPIRRNRTKYLSGTNGTNRRSTIDDCLFNAVAEYPSK